jgi:hypothetical protein
MTVVQGDFYQWVLSRSQLLAQFGTFSRQRQDKGPQRR